MSAIVRTDLVAGLKGDMVTVKNGEDVLENGAFVGLGALDNTKLGRSTRNVEKLTEGCQLAFIDDIAMMYDSPRLDERDWTLVANGIARARRAKSGEQVTLSKIHFDGTLAVGDKLQVKPTSYQLMKQTGETMAVAKVLEDTVFEGQASYMIEFI